MILVLYEMEVLAEKQKEFSQAVPLILKATPEQSGCLRHRLCRDVEDDNHLIILQAWKDQSSLDAHWRSESFGAFLGAFHLLRSKPLIQVHAVSYTAGEEVIKAVRAKVMSLDEVIIEK